MLNATFASSLGMLSLDEPAAGLDEHNMGCLPNAIGKLSELSKAEGLQILFVTHHAPQLEYLFDKVIRIEK